MNEKYDDLKSYLYMTLILNYHQDVLVLQREAQESLDVFVEQYRFFINAKVEAQKDGDVAYFWLTSDIGCEVIDCPEMHPETSVSVQWREGF